MTVCNNHSKNHDCDPLKKTSIPNNATIIITGMCGFIGSRLVRHLAENSDYQLICVDNLSHGSHVKNMEFCIQHKRCIFYNVDISDELEIKKIFNTHQAHAIIHLAANSHVDRSITSAKEFIYDNIIGTYNLLECARGYYLDYKQKNTYLDDKYDFRFIHVSTDEVFGSLEHDYEESFCEETKYSPRSPYSTTKASSDMLVKAWHHTYQLPTIVTNCSNNYGPCYFVEKLIPAVITSAILGKPIRVYGSGQQIRDWLYVDDHVNALCAVLKYGRIGQSYCIGGGNQHNNLQVVDTICNYLDDLAQSKKIKFTNNVISSCKELIVHVDDRPGHDFRYAVNYNKIQQELGWSPQTKFIDGIKTTVDWFLDNLEYLQYAKL